MDATKIKPGDLVWATDGKKEVCALCYKSVTQEFYTIVSIDIVNNVKCLESIGDTNVWTYRIATHEERAKYWSLFAVLFDNGVLKMKWN